jgi:hypothetical protein
VITISYESTNKLKKSAKLERVEEVLCFLGFRRYDDTPIGSIYYNWYDSSDYKSFVGVEAYIYEQDGHIIVDSRTRLGRSYWDLEKQNELISTLKEYFGGSFITDEGKNILFDNDCVEQSLISSGLFSARWAFNNALIRVKIYLESRGSTEEYWKTQTTGIDFLDSLNPSLFSNNLLIPYLVAIWEHYLNASYIAVLKGNGKLDKVLKANKLAISDIKKISLNEASIEETIASKLSFQRPQIICENFKDIEPSINLFSTLKSTQVGEENLFEFITNVIDIRNEFVHTGAVHLDASNEYIKLVSEYIELAVDKIYDRFGEFYSFEPLRDY